jgi:putative membrane protein
MKTLAKWILNAFAVIITAYILPGVHVNGFITALAVAVILGIVNLVLKPILLLLTLPITIITLGIFTLFINAFLVQLTSLLVPGFTVDGIWWAILFSLILSVVNSFLFTLSRE